MAGDAVEAAELEVARRLATAGQASGATFRYMRHVLGLKATELATMLDVAPETISRWERGERDVDRTAWLALATMISDRVEGREATARILEALREPAKLAKTTRFEMPSKRRTG